MNKNTGGLQPLHQGWIEKHRQERVETTIRVRYRVLDQRSADALLTENAYKDTLLDQVIQSAQGNRMLEGFMRNLGESGLYLAGDNCVNKGQFVMLELILPSVHQKIVRVVAQAVEDGAEEEKSSVVHRSGIKIMAIHNDDLKALQNYIISILHPQN
jgi:hypothetical protein